MTDINTLESLVRVVEGGAALAPAQTQALADALMEVCDIIALRAAYVSRARAWFAKRGADAPEGRMSSFATSSELLTVNTALNDS